ncbi:MAG: hypothetical protein KAU17_01045 [Spirochaetales bacterium]|nr:hypothetical protein [Spirochaetales bacterium]
MRQLTFSMMILFLFTLFPQTLRSEDFIHPEPEDLAARCRVEGDLSHFLTGDGITVEEGFSLLPRTPLTDTIIGRIEEVDYSYAIEFVSFIPYPGGNRPDDLLVYNLLRRISSLAGIEYYSASRGRMRIFFEESTRIDSLEDRNPIPDSSRPEIPPMESLYSRQKDKTFGTNYYHLGYCHGEGTIALVMENVTPLRYGFIPVVKEYGMQMHIIAIPLEKGFLFYGASVVDALNLPIIRKKVKNSFFNRLIALRGWFVNQISSISEN